MLSIGEFSKICSVTTKTLRYYDETGLIKPVHINNENGYRFYDISQLKTMLTINKLKGYELSLEEISEILKDGSDELLLRKITAKEKEMQSKMKEYGALLENIKTDIINLKKGVSIMSHLDKIEIKMVEQAPMNIFSLRQKMTIKDFNKYFGMIYQKIAQEKLTIAGAPMAIYHDKEFNPDDTDIEIAVPVKEAVKGTRDLPQTLCATTRLKGSYSELPGCYSKLMQWVEKENYQIISPPYEVYMNDPCETEQENLITDIYFPIKKA